MRVAMFEVAGKPLQLNDVPDPTPAPDGAVVRVERCGICSSDLHMSEAHAHGFPRGAVPGHEFAGEIVALGRKASGLTIGDRVAVLPALSCGACANCLAGRPFACRIGCHTLGVGLTWGGYAQYARVSARWCVKLPEALGAEDGALIEPLAVGLHATRLAKIGAGDRVLVIGAGPIGLAATYWATRSGARVLVTATSTRRAALASAMGADAFLVPTPQTPLEEITTTAFGSPADIVIECAGVSGTIRQAIKTVRRCGTVIVAGVCFAPEPIDGFTAMLKEVTLRFSFAFDLHEFQTSIDALNRGWLEPRLMQSGRVGLNETPSRFESLRTDKEPCKVFIDPWRDDASGQSQA